MPAIPRDRAPDSTLWLLSDGYLFVTKRCERYGSDVFRTWLMLREMVCMMGEEAAREFYVPGRFTRRGAIPLTALMLLRARTAARPRGSRRTRTRVPPRRAASWRRRERRA